MKYLLQLTVITILLLGMAMLVTEKIDSWIVIVFALSFLFHEIVSAIRIVKAKESAQSTEPQSVPAMQTALVNLRQTILSHLLGDSGADILEAIAKQMRILNVNKRKSIAIFVSDRLFWSILEDSFKDAKDEELKELYALVHEFEIPICWLGELPVYLSQKMTTAPVFVAGEIKWEIR